MFVDVAVRNFIAYRDLDDLPILTNDLDAVFSALNGFLDVFLDQGSFSFLDVPDEFFD